MIQRIRQWLIDRFLPVWAKESVVKENESLRQRLAEKETEIERLKAYIEGLETGIRSQRKIVINNRSAGK